MTTLVLLPLDTLFFRGGQPYNQDDPGQVEAASLFPPHRPTVVGAVRAAASRAMGWPDHAWDTATLGDGVDWQAGDEALGPLRFSGPYVLRDGEPLYPAPLNLVAAMEEGSTNLITYLAPSGKPLHADIGAARFPGPIKAGQTFKTLDGFWLGARAMALALNGGELSADQAVHGSHLSQAEPRIGIQRDTASRTTAERALYAAAHVRLAQDVALAVEVEGLPDVSLGGSLAPLGGEGRSVWIEQRDKKIELPQAPDLAPDKDGVLRYTVVLVTPADLGDKWPGPDDSLAGSTGEALPGRIVSACTGRAVMAGGWDGAARAPLPLRPLVSVGSVWFLEARAEDAQAARSWHGRAVGRSTGWGFGRVLIGRWPAAEEET
jgi:CRISPR-associated protein Cmr3